MDHASAAKRYVVWDGRTDVAYVEDPIWHDCFVPVDMRPVSVQKLRRLMLRKNVVPTVVYACKAGETAEEWDFDGAPGGVFTHCWLKVLDWDSAVTLRDAVRVTDEAMRDLGATQTCEVVCREDVLDLAVFTELPSEVHLTMVFEMCRPPGRWDYQT
jgi:hypothetical protein